MRGAGLSHKTVLAPLVSQTSTFALIALVVQNTSLAILLKLTYRNGAAPYAQSSVVFVTECIKFALCSLVTASSSEENFYSAVMRTRHQRLLFVPSFLYVVQNNLLFFGAKLLPAIVYIVCTQTKILTTALMSRALLGTRFTTSEYVSLLFLAAGIVLVQHNSQHEEERSWQENFGTRTVGVSAVLLASLTSGTAGVVLEKIYKEVNVELGSKPQSIWTRNVQLGLISLPLALIYNLSQEPGLILSGRFTAGFDRYVWGVVACQAAGGFIIAYVMKYANNILKCLAVAISICCCAVYSVAVGDLDISIKLCAGIITVNLAVYAFSMKPKTGMPIKYQLPK